MLVSNAGQGCTGATVKAHEVVQQYIEERILSGELIVGSLLPAERNLATQLGVSRSAVREALRTLAAQGLITSSVGAGPEGGTRITGQHGVALGKLLKMHVALAEFPIDDVVEVRVTLERSSVGLLSRTAKPEDLTTLADLLVSMEAEHMELDEFNPLDTAFHIAIAQLAGNQLMAVLTSAVRQSLAAPIKLASQQMVDWQAFRRDLLRQHRGVFEAIAVGEGERAADLMEEHIRTAYAILPIADTRPTART